MCHAYDTSSADRTDTGSIGTQMHFLDQITYRYLQTDGSTFQIAVYFQTLQIVVRPISTS